MNIILFDTNERNKLFPITLTRAVADIRMGIFTIKERWEKLTGSAVFVLTDVYLQNLYETIPAGDYLFVDARVMPNSALVSMLLALPFNQIIKDDAGLISGKTTIQALPSISEVSSLFKNAFSTEPVQRITFPQDIFKWNKEAIQFDYKLVTQNRTSSQINATVQVAEPSQVFIEEGAVVSFSILNALTGPIYIGKNATVMEGCLIRGPFVLGEGATLKMGTKIYGATTVGPYCTGGGEIKNSVMMRYSNKGHDGYLGDSVVGEWCNMGAGTSNSNVKNTAGQVSLWNYSTENFLPAGNKCGVIIGDYSRMAINSSINTGTVIGVCCNVFGQGLTPKFVPDFSWGFGDAARYDFEKAIKDIGNWKKMKNKDVSETETQVLKHIFEHHND